MREAINTNFLLRDTNQIDLYLRESNWTFSCQERFVTFLMVFEHFQEIFHNFFGNIILVDDIRALPFITIRIIILIII